MALRALDIHSRQPFEDGQSWSPIGAYEVLRGVAHFVVDPQAAANQRIVDLDRAATDEEGQVHFQADFCLLRPEQAPRGGSNLLFTVANRGRLGAIPFSLDTPWWDPTRESIAAGDGFLLRHGWTVAWCGWQWDVLSGPASLALEAPEALQAGQPIAGPVRVDFTSEVALADHALGDSGPVFTFRSYPAADVDQRDATLTVRDTIDGPRRLIDRDRWRFARDEGGNVVPDDERVWLQGGFEPYRHYEVTYRTRRSPVVGAGLLAVRDFVSFLRHGGAAEGNPLAAGRSGPGGVDHTFAYGASQSGRFLRHFLFEGLNIDERGQRVFDGVLPHIAGARRGEFNQRYGQPSHFGHSGVASLPPFAPADPGPEGGVFDRQLALGGMPRTMLTNTSWEYWRGDASLNHIDRDGKADLEDGPDTRVYLFAGTDHLGPSPTKDLMALANPANSLDSTMLLRAALMNLQAWVVEGTEPPPSQVPRLAEGTAVGPEEALAARPAIPGARAPEPVGLPRVHRLDLGPDAEQGVVRLPAVVGEPYPSFVAAADEDGNELPGIRLPELAVPVATYTGWNPRRSVPGLPDALHEFAGSEFPFPRTRAEAEAAGDPRRPLAERYPDREAYAAQLRQAVAALVSARHLLAEDAERATEQALGRYDELVEGARGS